MGYLLAIGLLVVLGIVLFVLAASRSRHATSGRVSSHGQAILREQPSADEPTPGRSATATPEEREGAQKRTPPA
jgi:hypothetical protein